MTGSHAIAKPIRMGGQGTMADNMLATKGRGTGAISGAPATTRAARGRQLDASPMPPEPDLQPGSAVSRPNVQVTSTGYETRTKCAVLSRTNNRFAGSR